MCAIEKMSAKESHVSLGSGDVFDNMAAIVHWGCHLEAELQYGVHTHIAICKPLVILYMHQLSKDYKPCLGEMHLP